MQEVEIMLKITDLQKTFNAGTVNAKTALDGLNLELKDGDFVTVIGGNGAGKSTLLNAIAGVWKPDYGTIEIDGVNVTNMPEHKRAQFLGRVFQDPMKGTAPDMEIAENLSIASKRGVKRRFVRGVKKTDRETYRELLASLELGLENRLSTKVGLLSGGQRQAVTLLMATMNKPKLLLLDEHTAALDPKTAAKVLELTDQIVSKNKLTTLMITHNMKDAIQHGNRLIMMYNGRVVIDVAGEEKKKLTVPQLLDLFSKVSGSDEASDKLLLG
jgi:putative ABC transport system ATP-binding protein